MKDTLITARRKRIELCTWLVCFVIANALNLYAIAAYGTSYAELLTSIFYVITFSCVLYVVWTLLRILFFGIKRLFAPAPRNKRLKPY